MMVLAGNWWAFVLRGILAILFGLMCFLLPGMALLTLVFMFGFYAIADGVVHLVTAFRRTGPEQQPWWALLISGVISIIAGALAIFIPGLTAITLLYIIAAWAIVTGILQIAAAIRLRKQISNEWLLVLSGLLSVIFGALVAIFPGAGALTIVLWIGAFAVVFGILLISLGVRLRQWSRTVAFPSGGFPATAH